MRSFVLAVPLLLLCAGFAQAQTDTAPPPPAPDATLGATKPDMAAKPKGHGMMKVVRPACRGDIKALCSDVQPGGGRIARCIRSHESQLSTTCHDALTQFRQSRLSGASGDTAAPH